MEGLESLRDRGLAVSSYLYDVIAVSGGLNLNTRNVSVNAVSTRHAACDVPA